MLCLAIFCLIAWTSAAFLWDLNNIAHLLTSTPFWLLSILTCITVSYWLNVEIRLNTIDGKPVKHQKLVCAFFSIPLTIFLAAVIGLTVLGFNLISQGSYKDRLKDFEKNSFGHIQKYASSNFKLPVVLLGENGWGFTQNTHSPLYSPGLNWMSSGYCVMIVDPDRIANMLPLFSPVDKKDWTTLILVHELGHCVDISRDMPMGFNNQPTGVHSLAPANQSVKDLPAYFKAEIDKSTVLWREAFSDVFAVGYAYLNLKDPDALFDALYAMREKSPGDVTHQTQCWLDAVKVADKPVSNETLKEWADNIRKNTKCPLSVGPK